MRVFDYGFYKVSKEQFLSQNVVTIAEGQTIKTNLTEKDYENIVLPKRATIDSAGYDIFSPVSFSLKPNEQILIPTGIRAHIPDNTFLMIVPRSGLGFKYRLQLNNTIGIIDKDYVFSDNEGHIMAKIINDSRDGKIVTVDAGKAFVQGIIVPFVYMESYDSNFEMGKRNGGFGSTEK